MANTIIALKKSATPGSTPSALSNGELAINYADGKLFYKAANGAITELSGAGFYYNTVNVGGTLLIADIKDDILSIGSGDNIILSANALNDSFTIAANLAPALLQANAAFDKANAANVLAFNTGIGANAYATSVGTAGNAYTQTVGTAGNNYTITVGASANGWANTISATRADSANNWANTKLSNSTTTLAGTLTITGDSLISGNVGIGITSPTSNLHVIGEANITSNLVVGGSVTAIDFNSVSDATLKENIDSITNSHQILSQINPVSFKWKSNGAKSYGILAQEVEQILPEIVTTNESGVKSVSYIQLIALLIDVTKNLQEEMEKIKSSISSCKKCKNKAHK
jgi:hypothetical protein